MGFRDDREALVHRAEALQNELDRERAEHAETRSERERLETALRDATRPIAPAKEGLGSFTIVMLVIGLAIAGLVICITVLMVRRTDQVRNAAVVAPSEPPPIPITPLEREQPAPERRPGVALTEAQISGVVGQGRPAMARCFHRASRARHGSENVGVIMWVRVAPTGEVVEARPNAGPGDLDCLEETVRGWRFPAADGPSSLEIPFVMAITW